MSAILHTPRPSPHRPSPPSLHPCRSTCVLSHILAVCACHSFTEPSPPCCVYIYIHTYAEPCPRHLLSYRSADIPSLTSIPFSLSLLHACHSLSPSPDLHPRARSFPRALTWNTYPHRRPAPLTLTLSDMCMYIHTRRALALTEWVCCPGGKAEGAGC